MGTPCCILSTTTKRGWQPLRASAQQPSAERACAGCSSHNKTFLLLDLRLLFRHISLLYGARRERYQPFFIVSYPMDVNFAFYTRSDAHSCCCCCCFHFNWLADVLFRRRYAVCSAAEQQQARSILCRDTRGTRGLHTAPHVRRPCRCDERNSLGEFNCETTCFSIRIYLTCNIFEYFTSRRVVAQPHISQSHGDDKQEMAQ
jgi:hypothetical protein